MRFRYVVAITALLVTVACCTFLYLSVARTGSQSSSMLPSGNPVVGSINTDVDAYDVLVTFDGEAFNPKDITVAKGTRVRFLNDSDDSVWPASAVHPTHSVYPEKNAANCLGSSFDACKALVRGEYFDFTFEYAGEWRYHDHVRAYKTGSVLVTE